jgi:hypothetical protein
MLRAAILPSILLMLGEMAHGGAPQSAAAQTAAERPCAPPENFSKRFPKLSEKKAVRKVTRSITRRTYGLLQTDNPVTGAEVTSNNLYAQTFLGVSRYGRDHTFAAIIQPLDGPRTYAIRISDTEYTTGSQPYFVNDLADLHVSHRGRTVVVPRSDRFEEGFCGPLKENAPRNCFNTATGSFAIERELFEELAASDPAKPIAITARKSDGTMAECPYYFSPLSFKATLLTIDEAFAEAAAKARRERAGK